MFNLRSRAAEPLPLNGAEERFATLRRVMVEEQIARRGITSPRVLDALLAVPRHEFVPEDYRSAAYADNPIAIGEGQTISQPFMVAAMTEALELAGRERVLEVGTGSGYQAALLSRLAGEVHSIERCVSLADAARARLAHLGCANVTVHTGDGTLGLPQHAPFDAIIVTAAAPHIPDPLIEQLAESGRLVIPVGDAQQQECLLVRKIEGRITETSLHYCRFVPLVGQHGWSDSSWTRDRASRHGGPAPESRATSRDPESRATLRTPESRATLRAPKK